MRKKTVLLFLAACCCGAAPTSQPGAQPLMFDGEQYALAMAGIYSPEERLLNEAVDPSLTPHARAFATVAAIVNEWRGPFRIHEFGLWLRKSGLTGRIRIAPIMGNAPRFAHLPDGFAQVSLQAIDEPNGDSLVEACMAVPGNVGPEEVQAILDDLKDDGTARTPVAYALQIFSFPGTYPGLKTLK